jgi:hypothetical protein
MSTLPPDWLDEPFMVYTADRYRAHGHTVDLLLEYDPRRELDGQLCNTSLINGMVCRCTAGHPGPHIPFTGELIATTGVYVRQVVPHGAQL